MRSFVRFLLWTTLIVGLIVGLARAVAIRWIRLPVDDPVLTTSLLPTLSEGDLILTWRLTKPRFGDLVVCPEPEYPARYVIGRIVGEAGDRVEVTDGVPTTNGKPYRVERSCDPSNIEYPHPDNPSEIVTQPCDWEAIANHLHMMGSEQGSHVHPRPVSMDVPEGKVFLMSDNRRFPYDSRDYALVDRASCKETVFARLVSKKGWMDSKNRMNYIQ